MSYTLGDAARATGRSKATIHRAVQSGKISATKDEATGAWKIDPAELHRVFPAVSLEQSQNGSVRQNETTIETLLRQQLEREREERQRERSDKDAVIADLREDRDRWRTQAEKLLLTDQRPKAPAEVIAMPPPSSNPVRHDSPPPMAHPTAAPPAVVKVRQSTKKASVPAKEVSWLRRMIGGK